jgi:uncharacterized peroxidase-related enzyme
MPFLPSMPKGSSLIDLFKLFPETSKPLIEFHEALLRGSSPFSEGERELIATYVSGVNQCRYCFGVHSATAELLGIPRPTIDLLIDDVEVAPVDEKMKPVLRYAGKLTRDPRSVSQVDADAILAAGWDETALYHCVAITALFNFMNRLVEGMGIELDRAYIKPASERLAKGGYLPLLAMLSK